jgi:benzoate 4-monooxygenase
MTQSHVFSDFFEPTTLAIYFLAAPLGLTFLYLVVPHFTSLSPLRRFPGPLSASFTRLWLAKQARVGKRSEIVHKEHLKHGEFSLFATLVETVFSATRWRIVACGGHGDSYEEFLMKTLTTVCGFGSQANSFGLDQTKFRSPTPPHFP